MKPSTKSIKICPKCLASDYYELNETASMITGKVSVYECKKCGFKSRIFPEIDTDEYIKMEKEKESHNKRI